MTHSVRDTSDVTESRGWTLSPTLWVYSEQGWLLRGLCPDTHGTLRMLNYLWDFSRPRPGLIEVRTILPFSWQTLSQVGGHFHQQLTGTAVSLYAFWAYPRPRLTGQFFGTSQGDVKLGEQPAKLVDYNHCGRPQRCSIAGRCPPRSGKT